MIRPPSSPPRLAAALALLALSAGSRLAAAQEAAPAHEAPAAHAEPAHVPPPAPTHDAHAPAPTPAHDAPAAVETHPAAPVHDAAPPPAADHPTPPADHVASPTAPAKTIPAKAPAKAPAAKPAAKASPAPHAEPAAHGAKPAEADAHAAKGAHAPLPATPAVTNEEIQSLIKLGGLLTDRANYESAEIAFYQVLNNRSASAVDIKSSLLGLARMHRKAGALTKAAAIYERFLKDYPNDERTPDALLDLGRTLRALGVYKGAIARFYSVINSTIKLPSEGFEHYQVLTKTAQFEIAETHFQSGDFAEAAKFYTRLRLLDLAPADRARAHFKAAYSTRLKGDLEGAVTTLRAYIDQWPEDENVPEARYLLAVSLRELKRTEEAFVATLELLRTEQSRVARDPKRWAYWQRRTGNQLANDFFESGNTLNAQAIYSGLVDLSPEATWRLPLTYQIALCHERLGTNDRARAAYQTIVDTAGATPPPELAELARMAAWRLNHLSWREGVTKQVTSFFETTTGKVPPTPPPAPAADALAKPMPAPALPAPAPVTSAAPATPAPAAAAPAAGAKTASLP